MDAKNVNQVGSKRKAETAAEEVMDKNPGEDSEFKDDDDRKLEEKRAYNRRNAARARQRTKDHILELTARAERYAAKNDELQKANDSLLADVKALTEENQRLRQLVRSSNPGASGSAGTGSVNTAAASGLPLGASPAGAMHAVPGGSLGGGTAAGGATLMDQGSLHGPGNPIYFQQNDPGAAAASGMSDGNAAAAARQRGLLLQLLQQQSGQGEGRPGLPPGYNF